MNTEQVPSRSEALVLLADLTPRLANLRLQLADTLIAEHTARTESWVMSDQQSVSGRDRVAEINSTSFTNDVMKLKGDIAALEDERDFLNLCVHWNHPTIHVAGESRGAT